MLRISCIGIFLLFVLLSNCQNKSESVNKILIKYLVIKGVLNSEDSLEYSKHNDNLYVEELLNKDLHAIKNDSFGIYQFYFKKIEDTNCEICICSGESINVFDFTDINPIVQFLIDMNKNTNNLSDAKLLSYIKALSNLYYSENLLKNRNILLLYEYGNVKFWINTDVK